MVFSGWASGYSHGGYKVVVVASVLILMQTLMVSGRLLSRHLQKVALAVDDYVLFVATVSLPKKHYLHLNEV